ncbi:MAG TPA: dienelactone hydrolase family protein [Dehalococcoidia bacterium]|nr:dienelactone hydrolase family protein [Dehalococcoidia bacterium]
MAPEIMWTSVELSQNGSKFAGYLVRPNVDEARPGVVVIQEWWGLEPHIKDVVQRFAREGYVAIAPDLYDGRIATEPNEAQKIRMALDVPQAVQRVNSAARYLKSQQYSRGQKVGTIGFCMGGMVSLATACDSRDIDAAVVFYGRNPDPIEKVENVSCPLLGIYGEADQGIPVSEVERLREALNRFGKQASIHIYPQAPHAFFNDTKESHRPEAAQDAWQKTLAFFRQNLG